MPNVKEEQKLYCPNEGCKREVYVSCSLAPGKYYCQHCFSSFEENEVLTEGFKKYEYEPVNLNCGMDYLFNLLNEKKENKKFVQILDTGFKGHFIIWENVRD